MGIVMMETYLLVSRPIEENDTYEVANYLMESTLAKKANVGSD